VLGATDVVTDVVLLVSLEVAQPTPYQDAQGYSQKAADEHPGPGCSFPYPDARHSPERYSNPRQFAAADDEAVGAKLLEPALHALSTSILYSYHHARWEIRQRRR
jgi:hypothetical protein